MYLLKEAFEIVKSPKTVGFNWETSFGEQSVNAHRNFSAETSDYMANIIILKPTHTDPALKVFWPEQCKIKLEWP